MNMKIASVAALFVAAFSTAPAFAQPYPSKPIRLIVSLPAGGGVDIMARLVAQGLSTRLGQQIVVENRPGAAGTIATQTVARAPADGYTLLASSNIEITITPNLQAVGYDPLKDLSPLVKTVTVPSVLVSAGNAPYRSMKELLALIRSQTGKYSYGTPGTGSAMHIAIEVMREKAGLDLVQVPYKGAPPVLADAMAGSITFGVVGLPPAVSLIRSGKLQALALLSPKRSAVLPDTPTFSEATGMELTDFPIWYAFFAPGGTPAEINAKLEAEILATLKDPELAKRLVGAGMDVTGQAGQAFHDAIKAESGSYAAIFKRLKIRAE
ncbi:MAG: tripartite tricarboxylate transporter substrate binding protein [Betaproteobacteria bacterium]